MDAWTLILWIVAGYVALVALVRLMIYHRSRVTAQFRDEVEKEKSRRKSAKAGKPGAARK
jgi:hypothetical protein